MTRPRIFVHTPAYRDRECQWTMRDMFAKATYPDRVFAGICWQIKPDEDDDCFQIVTRPDQVRSLTFDIAEARGLGWARRHAVSLWRGEEYSLQIDSHMRFVPDWDEKMLTMLAQCDSPDPVLTVYPAAYTPPDRLEENPARVVQCINRFLPNGILEFTARKLPDGEVWSQPRPTAACAGGFIFGSSRVLRDVPFDPEIYFTGEEPSLALRLWTHGFDLFSPNETVIFHYYRRDDGTRHWNDSKAAELLGRRTARRMRALCQPTACSPEEVEALGLYGLGSRRTLAEYEAFSGVNFAGRTIASYAHHFPYVRVTEHHALTLDAGLTPAPDLHLFLLDDEGVLFAAEKGEFYRLNALSAFAWCALEDGMDWSSIIDALAERRGIPADAAGRELTDLAAHWLGLGILRRDGDEPAPPAREPDPVEPPLDLPPRFDPEFYAFRDHNYRMLGVDVRIRYGDEELEAAVHPVLAHLEFPPGDAAHTIIVARIAEYIYAFNGNEPVFFGEDVRTLAPKIKFTLLRHAIDQSDHILHLHAAAVAHRGRLIVLPASSGSGKTMLTAGLIAAGCEYFSDEVVLLGRGTGLVRPAPVALCLKEGGVKLLAGRFPDISGLAEYIRQDELTVRYLAPPVAAQAAHDRVVPPSLLIFPRHLEGAPVAARPLSRAEAFGRLLRECAAIPRPLDLADAAVLIEMMEGLHCYELTGGDLDATTRQVMALCEALPPRAE